MRDSQEVSSHSYRDFEGLRGWQQDYHLQPECEAKPCGGFEQRLAGCRRLHSNRIALKEGADRNGETSWEVLHYLHSFRISPFCQEAGRVGGKLCPQGA